MKPKSMKEQDITTLDVFMLDQAKFYRKGDTDDLTERVLYIFRVNGEPLIYEGALSSAIRKALADPPMNYRDFLHFFSV